MHPKVSSIKQVDGEIKVTISQGALSLIQDLMRDGVPRTALQVGDRLYADNIFLDNPTVGDKRQWAHDHLQYLNGVGRRAILTDGKVWKWAD